LLSPGDPRGLLPRLTPLVAFVRLAPGSLEECVLGRKAPRVETSTTRLAGRMTAGLAQTLLPIMLGQ